ncbi:Rubredoxin-2 [Zhongshania aliphaticivorans]|jgi:rubredoxin|uniref:Rubredoxin n=1 Tax=Zhongshania aliphaticivorans TaxID=1470434 RepID=A0A5S9PS59_9GAMM|nr:MULTISPECIES: rubredoxin [Spongiibacteraceae]CAA0106991.1 Rubredoxin-2 [Zhongshania aliphaticivorans]CAA0107109.1 Rubredoxin-2 [Zhongshania aliphaticivorans]
MFEKYECIVCGFIYDEEIGIPDDGIIAGTKWKDIPESWTCFECSAPKSDFEKME